jgi:hypothetical protein
MLDGTTDAGDAQLEVVLHLIKLLVSLGTGHETVQHLAAAGGQAQSLPIMTGTTRRFSLLVLCLSARVVMASLDGGAGRFLVWPTRLAACQRHQAAALRQNRHAAASTAGALAAVAGQLSGGRPPHLRRLAAELLTSATALEFSTCRLLLAAGPLAGLLQMVHESAGACSPEQLELGYRAAGLLQNVAGLHTSAARAALLQAGAAATALLQPLLGPVAAAGTARERLQQMALSAVCNLCQGEPALQHWWHGACCLELLAGLPWRIRGAMLASPPRPDEHMPVPALQRTAAQNWHAWPSMWHRTCQRSSPATARSSASGQQC